MPWFYFTQKGREDVAAGIGVMSRNDKILIASAKGGVGKSTTALGLALAFSEMGKSVLLIDCDSASRSLDLLCGNDSSVLYDLGDIMLDRVDAADAVTHPFADYPDLAFCAAPHVFQDEEVFAKTGQHLAEQAGKAVKKLMECVPRDVVIVDTSSGEGPACAAGLLGEITTVLVTAEQSKTSIRAAEYTAFQMEKMGITNQRLVVCSFDAVAAVKGQRAGIIEMIDRSTLKCVGVVPYDARLVLRQENGDLPDKKCISKTAYRNIAERLSGNSVPLFTGMKELTKKRTRIL